MKSAPGVELARCRSDCRRIEDIEFDADQRHRRLRRPICGSKARLGGLRNRPDTERLAAGDLLALMGLVAVARVLSSLRSDLPGRMHCDSVRGWVCRSVLSGRSDWLSTGGGLTLFATADL
jgi:hypothetical protein